MAKAKHQEDIRNVIEGFYQTTRDIRFLSSIYVGVAASVQEAAAKKYVDQMGKARKLLKARTKKDKHKGEVAFHRAITAFQPYENGNHPELLAKSLFINSFACFDAFMGNLLRAVYSKEPRLQKSIEKTLNFDDLGHFSSVGQLKQYLVEKEIDSFRRDGYVKQFKALESKLNIKTLREFKNWPAFVEASQRRHLFTHCEGIVTKQYLSVCREAGYKFDSKIKVGTKLEMNPKYHQDSIQVVAEVGVKLGITIWRKLFPEEIPISDQYLASAVVEAIKDSASKYALSLGEFAVGLPNISGDLYERMFAINYAQSLKWFSSHEDCSKFLKKYDWTASSVEFQLAVAVLLEDFDKAKNLMVAIGSDSETVGKMDYLNWPLFKEFSKSDEFKTAFKRIFRQDAFDIRKREADEAGDNA